MRSLSGSGNPLSGMRHRGKAVYCSSTAATASAWFRLKVLVQAQSFLSWSNWSSRPQRNSHLTVWLSSS